MPLETIKVQDLDAVIQRAANGIEQVLRSARQGSGLYQDGMARIVLTGGGAGIGTLQELARRGTDISNAHFFFGDERNVPSEHPDSNEGQARAALLEAAEIPEAQIHGMQLDGSAMQEAADAYEQAIKEFAPDGFDLHLLGMGGEGHINSLFPESSATAERERLVCPVEDSPKPPAQRVTLTLPAVALAQRVWLLVAGEEKAEAVRMLQAAVSPDQCPAAGAHGREETLLIVAENACT
ncbi:6-phosphogluconolactonase [Corynebacterium gerontici]|uniref:6-phosphogluconolactonase n=1 Tax=Corynebacterium gerontici TaxID=2079234 RepID=A0A3G6J117_9CORY|nr:6-phosphogluconolactonase [Corynebacterium gerontici]AZA11483.1 6-phosphogluconolactonase [Corynebacterium gerontici]